MAAVGHCIGLGVWPVCCMWRCPCSSVRVTALKLLLLAPRELCACVTLQEIVVEALSFHYPHSNGRLLCCCWVEAGQGSCVDNNCHCSVYNDADERGMATCWIWWRQLTV
ncbi:hypothetical protein COO60DRAFT_1559462 [Scenedesmus sp. NREL 46B-D3]|nr:hypothetical protein COO60DRAFT_1559462 [Scenedesmus sp. NREL 46B-D3]